MGKQGKKQSHLNRQQRRGAKTSSYYEEQDQEYPSIPLASAFEEQNNESQQENSADEVDENEQNQSNSDVPSKFWLYQQSVQSPKGDISYLQKFFLMYVGGRMPLHLQEDFCGTALLSVEWLRTDARRTAVGLDFDVDALNWCVENNVNKVGADVSSRLFLFHGSEDGAVTVPPLGSEGSSETMICNGTMKDTQMPARDIVCAFNYSCCCLHSRKELVLYFKYAHSILSKRGGIFVMDVYGGTSAECELRMQRKFSTFTYVWEQEGFDVIQRKTRISLHFNLQKQHKKIRHAFSYSWRLWSLPEIKDCLDEAGFSSVHFWVRSMPDSEDIKTMNGFGVGRDIKYEHVTSFHQQDSWNAYIVGVA
ncbi:hypothetical protein Leryth_000274 [Lithospermum erythrorhizon]|nr:hypothetical protein Leryth_000274 [Lithospermum erythrorhizon]